jgi:D-alanyl-D-alanine carboxypeptidase (penicillin-binding protein 5/6)
MKAGWKWIIRMLLTSMALTISIAPPTAVAAPTVSAQGAAVIDVDSGRILYDKNGDQKMRIASLTKIMTAIVAIEESNIKDLVAVPDYAIGVEGSSIYLRHGEKLTLEQLLYGLMLRSGNDAAVAIAHHVGGSLEGFVHLMNEKAKYLGLSATSFGNPHGLDDNDHQYSTPNDMAKLSAYALKNETFQQIVATQVKKIPLHGEKWDRKLINKNKMLRFYEGANGVKTGYTKLARRCLVSSAERDDRKIAVVTLNAPNDWEDHSRLLDYAFQQFTVKNLIQEGEQVPNTDFYALDSFSYPLSVEEEDNIQLKVVKESGYRDLLPGGVPAHLKIYLKKEPIGSVPLHYGESNQTVAERSTVFERFWVTLKQVVWGGW